MPSTPNGFTLEPSLIRPVAGSALDPGFYGREITSIPVGAVWRRTCAYLPRLPSMSRPSAPGSPPPSCPGPPPPRPWGISSGHRRRGNPRVPRRPRRREHCRAGDPGRRLRACLRGCRHQAPRQRAVRRGHSTAPTSRPGRCHRRRRAHHRRGRLHRRRRGGPPADASLAGPAHPARPPAPAPAPSLAVRMAALYAVMVIPGRVLAVRRDAQAGRRGDGLAAGNGTIVEE